MAPLANLRVLVVEDEVFVALDIEDRLRALGCEVVGPLGRFDEALDAAASAALDGALLDIHVRGGVIFPVADKLLERHVPVLLSSGYAPETLPHPWRNLPYLRKPYSPEQLAHAVMKAFGDRRGGGGGNDAGHIRRQPARDAP